MTDEDRVDELLADFPVRVEIPVAEQSDGVGPILHSTSCRYRIPLTHPDTVSVGARVAEVAEDLKGRLLELRGTG